MKIILAFLVFTYCCSEGNATLGLLKAKVNSSPLLQSAIRYLASSEPLPASYARPTYTTHVSTFSVSLPSVEHLTAPITTTYGLPHVHASTYSTPAVVYAQPFTVAAPVVHYHTPETVYIEPIEGRVVEEHYDEQYAKHLPLNTHSDNW